MDTVEGSENSKQKSSSPSPIWSPSSRSSNIGVIQSEADSSSTSDSDVASSDLRDGRRIGWSATVALSFHPGQSEMKAVFDRFDENDDGLICAEDLARFVKRLGFSMSVDEARSLVRSVDHNHDGKLDFEEFYSLYPSLADSLSGGHANGQKTIEEERLDTIYEEDEDTLLQAFKMYDADNNGYISVRELQTVLKSMGLREGQSLRRCQRVITQVAANPEQGVNLREFKAMMCSRLEGSLEP